MMLLPNAEETCMAHNNVPAAGDARIDTAVLAALIRSGVRIVLLDARAHESDDGRRIPGAVTLAPGAPRAVLDSVIGPRPALIVSYSNNLYCPEGMRLARYLRHCGYENVLDYPDGLAGWVAAGYAVEAAQQTPPPGPEGK